VNLRIRVNKLSKRGSDNTYAFVRFIKSQPLPANSDPNSDSKRVKREPIEQVEWEELCRTPLSLAKKSKVTA
jgi:hypothetical protein